MELGRGTCSKAVVPHAAAGWAHTASKRTHRRRDNACRALFDPPPFKPEMLTVTYHECSSSRSSSGSANVACSSSSWQQHPQGGGCAAAAPSTGGGARPTSRRYTLTHNDITGALRLTVGSDYNYKQISGFYTRLLRDEVIAEWVFSPQPSLHVYCHVSGEERWLAPPHLRNYIFRRELPLVLDTFTYADQQLLHQHPELQGAEVFVHFQSTQPELDAVERWGILGQRHTWTRQESMLKRLLMSLIGWQDAAPQQPVQLQQQLPQPGQQAEQQQQQPVWPQQTVLPASPTPLAALSQSTAAGRAQVPAVYGGIAPAAPIPVVAALSVLRPDGAGPCADAAPAPAAEAAALEALATSSDELGGVVRWLPHEETSSAPEQPPLQQQQPVQQEPVLVLAAGASTMLTSQASSAPAAGSNGRSGCGVVTGNGSSSSGSAFRAMLAQQDAAALAVSAVQLQPVPVAAAAQPTRPAARVPAAPGKQRGRRRH